MHYEHSLKYYYGLKPWIHFATKCFEKRESQLDIGIAKAEAHWGRKLKQKTIEAWLAAYVQSFEESDFPSKFYEKSLLSRTFNALKVKSPYEPIIHQFRLYNIGAKAFDCWKLYSINSKEQREYDHKRAQMLNKVNSWLEGYKTSNLRP
mmetsp:Transcript_31953/g.55065  ORF Transcript_31953/g.55065 Transcript_31953/m.55065 type:complete len:149 (-) Transcript_31953:1301-1747(-)